MSYSRRRLLRTNENIPNFLPQDVSKHQVVKKTRINSTTQASETGNTHRPRTDKRFSDSDDLGLFSAHVDDIEDSTHSFVSLFLSSRQTPKPSTSAIMEIRSSTEPTETIYPWLNTTNIDNGETIRDTNKKDKKTKSNKQEKEEKRKAKKESRNKHENLDSLNKKVRGTRNKWKKEQREKIKEQVQKICTGDPSLFGTPLVSAQSSNLAVFTLRNLPTTFSLESDLRIYIITQSTESIEMEDHFMSISPSFTSAHVDLNLNEKSLYQDVKSLSVTTEYTTVSSTEYFHNSLFVDATTISNVYSAVGKTERIRTVSDKISSNEDKNTSKRKRLRADIMNKLKNITTLSDRRKKVKINTPRSNKQKKQKQKETKKVNALISSASQQTTTVQPNTTKNGAKIDTGFESKIKTETETNKLPEETNPIHKDSQREKKPVQMDDGLNNDTGINSEGKTYNGSKSQDKPNSKDKLKNGISKMDSFDDVTPVSGHDDQYLDNNDTEQGTRKESSEYPNYSYHNDPDFINGNDTLISAADFICESKDFIGAQGKRCCQKSIKCFGDLPQLIDEIETYNNSEDQDDLQRQHVCQHIKNSMLCMGHAMALPVCKSSVTFVHRKLNDTLSDVTQFHTESCQTGSSPPPIIPTTATTSVTSSSEGIGNHRGFKHHTHEHTNYAAIIGGVAGGAILIFLIILILLLLRKNKSKRPSEFSGKDSDGGMTLSNGSSRYKTHIGLSRKQSEVYAEIDESSMHSNQSFSDKRPLPSAPSNGPVSSDNTGYLTPRSSKDELGLINDRDSGGYHVLQKEPSRKPSVDAYEKLQNEEGEYIEPTHTRDSRVRIPSQKAPQNNTSNISKPNGDDNYHMYFVLEKENAVHV